MQQGLCSWAQVLLILSVQHVRRVQGTRASFNRRRVTLYWAGVFRDILILGLTPVDFTESLENHNSQKCLAKLGLLSLLSGLLTWNAGKANNVLLCSWLPQLTT